ncbi:MAG: hypothetical protein LM576_08135 [Thermofilum sp.]|nr:hypothetical protein [Thermofilum sp.]
MSLASEPGSAQYCNKPTSLSILSPVASAIGTTIEVWERRWDCFQFFPSCCFYNRLGSLRRQPDDFQFFPSCCIRFDLSMIPDIRERHFQFFPSRCIGAARLFVLFGYALLSILSQLLLSLASSHSSLKALAFNSFPVAA